MRYIFLLAIFVCHNLFALTADDVLKSVEDRYIGKNSKSVLSMQLVDGNGKKRNRTLNIYRKKQDSDNKDNFIHFLSPSDIKDTTYLVNERNREKAKWIYLSAFKNIRKIVATDYGMSFVSSDFTYEDMDDIHASDYKCSNLQEEIQDGEPVYSIDCVKKDSNTSYSRIVLKVSKEKKLPLRTLMYDKSDPKKLVKEAKSEKLQKIQEIWTPFLVTMMDLNKKTSTALELSKVEYDISLEDSIFSQRNMKK